MLNTLEDVAKRVGRDIATTAIVTIGQKNKWYLYMIKEKRGVIGAAINAVGKSAGDKGIDTYYWWALKVARENDIPYDDKQTLGANSNQVYDLLQIGRNIEMEMNRVRLPVPENFRQFLHKITQLTLTATKGGQVPLASGNIIGTNEVHLIEGMKAIRQLLNSITVIRGEIRIIIDKAKLEVEEETLRRESEALKRSEELKKQAEEEKKRIEAEKLEYQRRLEKLEAERAAALAKSQSETQTAALNADLLQLTVQKQAAESVATNQQRNVIVTAANTGTIPAQQSLEKEVEQKFTPGKLVPIVVGALALYSMT